MSLKRNIIANYASQIYVISVGILLVPQYIKYMGAEAYGLVGFFVMLQAWFNLLDMGLTPTISRESARFHGGAISILEYRRLARTIEGMFCLLAMVGGILLFSLAEPIAENWVNAQHLDNSEIIASMRVIAIIVVLRWMSGFYRGVILGAERLVWLSGFSSALATLRFVFVLPLLMFVDASPIAFFGFQLLVALFELGLLGYRAYRLMPNMPVGQSISWEWDAMKPVLKFSMSIAFTSSIWVLVTQTDKLVLSKVLTLSDYGYFTAVVMLASGILTVGSPISSALMPRMARLNAEGSDQQLLSIYRKATQKSLILIIPATLVLSYFSSEVLWAWTGNSEMVSNGAPALALYSVGYGFLALSAFPYYLQYAKGDLKLHIIGNALFLVALIPAVVWSSLNYGMTGAGWAWAISNLVYFFGWTPLIHQRFAPKIHLKWLFQDIIWPLIPALVLVLLTSYSVSWSAQRELLLVQLVVFGFFLLLVVFISQNATKSKLSLKISSLINFKR